MFAGLAKRNMWRNMEGDPEPPSATSGTSGSGRGLRRHRMRAAAYSSLGTSNGKSGKRWKPTSFGSMKLMVCRYMRSRLGLG
jgi:hypothetical protein